MDNSSYLNQMYSAPIMQDVSGLAPVFQNIGAQQALHNQLMQQQNQQNQDSSNIASSYGKSLGSFSPLAMASALRGQPGLGQTTNIFGKVIPDPTYGAGTAYNNMSGSEIANMMQNGL
jgi:hypothetical protein